MHNLFLSSDKKKCSLTTLPCVKVISVLFKTVDAFIVIVPSKIQSGFASFTADQWVLHFSLRDVVTGDVLECW